MLDMLANCRLCPRNCGVDRINDKLGFCRSGSEVKIARVSLHEWEEPCISGTKGSGTVFFSNCTLKCVFCQNHDISQSATPNNSIGKEVSIERLGEIFLEQQQRGAHNINLVTPTHYVPQIIEAIKIARNRGLVIPIIYNSSGYENIETVKALEGYINVYVPDLKYFDDKFAEKYSNVSDYFLHASKAITEMVNQVGQPQFDEDGLIRKGVIIRHLMLPGLLFDSKKVVDYIFSTFGDSVFISLMNQYTPMHNSHKYSEISKPLNPKHYDSLIDYALSIGVTNGFIQESGTSSEVYVPDFDLRGI